MINGIPCQIKTEDEKGNFTKVETFVFASFRKAPKLVGILKKLNKEETKGAKIERLVKLAAEELDLAAADQVDAAAEKLEKITDQSFNQDGKVNDLFHEFMIAGLTEAGYTETDAERYASYMEMDRLPELIAKARMGAGRVDFS